MLRARHGCTPLVPRCAAPVCRTGRRRREQWSSCGVKDGRRHLYLDQPVDERVIPPPGRTGLRRRIASGVLGSPQAVGRRLGVSRRPVAVRSRQALLAGVASWSSVRLPGAPTCARIHYASQRVPPTSQVHPALNRTFSRLPACLCLSRGSPRDGRFWQPEADDPRPSGAPSLRRTAAS